MRGWQMSAADTHELRACLGRVEADLADARTERDNAAQRVRDLTATSVVLARLTAPAPTEAGDE